MAKTPSGACCSGIRTNNPHKTTAVLHAIAMLFWGNSASHLCPLAETDAVAYDADNSTAGNVRKDDLGKRKHWVAFSCRRKYYAGST